jgi:hypothetical protein
MIKSVIFVLVSLFVGAMTMSSQNDQPKAANAPQKDGQSVQPDKREHTVQLTITPIKADAVTPTEQFKVGAKVIIQVSMTNTATEPTEVAEDDDYFHYRMRLMKDGHPLQFPKKMLDAFRLKDTEGPRPISTTYITLSPNQQTVVGLLELGKWYGPLEPGQYQLTVRYRFRTKGKPIESNTVTFEVIP